MQITLDIPDNLLDLYRTRRTSYNAWASQNGAPLLPPATKATLERIVRDLIKGYIRAEANRLDPGDGSVADQDEVVIRGA